MLKNRGIAFVGIFCLLTTDLHAASGASNEAGFQMMILLWICFIVLLLIGKKVAWKPIVDKLIDREDTIRTSLEDAKQARQEREKLVDIIAEEKRQAQIEARKIISDAQQTAVKVADEIKNKANLDATKIKEQALQEIETSKNEVYSSLKKESATLAINLASKLIGKNLDDASQRQYVEQAIKEL